MSEEIKELSYGEKASLEAMAARDKAAAELMMAEKAPISDSVARAEAMKFQFAAVGRAAVIHAIWASSLVSITWILVVKGWRG